MPRSGTVVHRLLAPHVKPPTYALDDVGLVSEIEEDDDDSEEAT